MRILLVVEPERFDFYNYLAENKGHDYMLLWYEKPEQMQLDPASLPIAFTDIYYWSRFRTPRQLIETVRPDKIVFFQIMDQRQIPLVVTAKAMGISTFYLEHGAAGDREATIFRFDETTFTGDRFPYMWKRLKSSFTDILRTKWYYYSVRRGFSSFGAYLQYLSLPVFTLFQQCDKVLSKKRFRERVPDHPIVFSRLNFETFELLHGTSESEALFTGLPMYDSYFAADLEAGDHIVYIDHPHLEQAVLNWDKAHHKMVAEKLFRFAEQQKLKLYIKLHPRSSMDSWADYEYDPRYVEIIQFGDYTRLFLESKMVLGFSSSLITGLMCAKKNIVLLGWHPEPGIFGNDFSETGLCHKSLDINDLDTQYAYWLSHNKCLDNAEQYDAFLKQCNYPFDGQAKQRIFKAITEL